jgi:protein-S-isoprenylcysteine O-methyltransferase Ste14
MRLISILGLMIMVAAMLGLWYDHALYSPTPIVIGVQAAAICLVIWARITFGRRSFHAAANPTEGGLMTKGPYRFIRHPIYTAACVICLAGILAHPSIVSITLGALLFVGTLMRMLTEERLVTERYPAYREYARVTKRMVPYVF